MNQKSTALLAVIVLFLLAWPLSAGDANYQSYFGARTLALNGLFIAGSDGIMANMVNPASAAYLEGAALDLSLLAKIGEYSFNNNVQGVFHSFRKEDLTFGLGGYWNLTPGWVISLGYLPVLDYFVDWPYAMVLGSDASEVLLTFNMNNKIQTHALTFDIAFRTGMFAFGLALNAYQVSQVMNFPKTTADWQGSSTLDAAYQFTYDQEAWTYGINLGVSADVSRNMRISALLHSAYQAKMKGDAVSDMFQDLAQADTTAGTRLPPAMTGIQTEFDFPWMAGAGVVWKVSENLQLNFDLMLALWDFSIDTKPGFEASGFRGMSVQFDDRAWTEGMSQTDTLTGITPARLVLPSRNALEAGIGLEYASSPELVLRAGYRYSQSPNIPQTYQLAFPTVSQHWVSAGIGYKEENYMVDISVAYGFGVTQTIGRADNTYFYGDYQAGTFIPAVSLKYGL